jgi:putative ABC transport system permease protein
MPDQLVRDFRFALRGLRREPTFALTAIVALAIGVVTVTTTFSVADAELWKPLPYPHPEQLVAIYARGPGARAQTDPIAGADLIDWRAGAPAFSELAATGRTLRRVLRLDTAESVLVNEVTANYFTTLGRQPIAGRTFGPDDARKSQAALLTDRAWRRLFAADASVVGRQLFLDDQPIVIAGIVAVDDSLGPDGDLYLPIDESTTAFLDRDVAMGYGAIGRLQPGAEASVVHAQLQATAARIAQMHPEGRAGHTIFVEDLGERFAGYNWRPLYYFLGGAIVVLLLSAVNVATLLLGRAVRRTREFALRGALGGGLGALARQLLAEGAVIAIPGGTLGVLASAWALKLFTAELPSDFLARGSEIPIDLRVMLFTVAVSALTTVAFVMAPLLFARRIDLMPALGAGGRTGASVGEGRARMALLAAQLALTVVLLFGAGLFVKSFVALTHVPLGFDPVNAVAIRSTLSGPRYAADDQIRRYASDLVDRAAATPGVRDAAIASTSPLGSGPLIRFARADGPALSPSDAPSAIVRAVSPSYFRTVATRVIRGREFLPTDVAGAPRVAIVNEQLADQVFPGEDALGKTINLLPARAAWISRPGPVLIVGVASRIKEVGINEIDFPDVYLPFAQMPAPALELVARTNVPASTLLATLRQRVASLDPAIPVTSATTFEGRLADALQGDRFNLVLTSAFAAVAVLLASIGVFGAVSYAVQARTREFGVRLAFGARPSQLIRSALWHAGRIAVVGGAVGLGLTLILARVIGDALYLVPRMHNGLLFGVTTTDPAMLASAFGGIVFVALLAGAVPARRVGAVDPVRALRAE